MITASAPASVALRAFCAKPQSPRSTSAILPAIAAALVNGLQPSVDVPPISTASTAASTLPATFGCPIAGPNAAVPNWYAPAMLTGELTATVGLPNDSTFGTPAVT